MEAKLRIIEIYPKIQSIKNNTKDIISISFISNDYSVKIVDIEQTLSKKEKIIIDLKEQNTKRHLIKCILLRNKNNIIYSGELTLKEGINWYHLNETKNNKMSKESLITSSTSNGNIQKISNSPNLSDNDNARHSLNTNTNLTKLEFIKIKLMVYYIKRRYTNKNNNNAINETGESSFRLKDSSFEKGNDYFECSMYDMDINKLNKKLNLLTTDKKNTAIKKSILFGNQTKKLSQKKIKYNHNTKNELMPIESGENITINNTKDISDNLINKTFKTSSKKKFKIIKDKEKSIYEGIKMKTSFNFYKRKNNLDNKYVIENKIPKKKSINKVSHHKLNSCENFEDKILDQDFQNYLKNDENLRANLFVNNSFNSLERISTERQQDSNNETNKNDNQLQTDNIDNNTDKENNYIKENYERLKIDFLLLYTEENIKNINNEDIFMETQLMGEKLLKLQHYHQKEYHQLFSSIKNNKKMISNYQKLYILQSKKNNKLNLKKLENTLNKSKNEVYNETKTNFIKVRKRLIKDSEFPIWDNLMMNSDKASIINNTKNKMTNIFLNICSKKQDKLNKLSLKFYNEIKDKQNNKNNKTIIQKTKSKYKSFDQNKIITIDTKINTKFNDNHFIPNKTSKNHQNNMSNIPSSRSKKDIKTKKKSSTKFTNNKNNNANNHNNIINETMTHNNNTKKRIKKIK